MVTCLPLTTTARVQVLTLKAWWHCGNMFASHRYSLGSTPSCMWDVFHPSQPMPGGFPLGVFYPQKGSKLFQLELSHKADWPGLNLFWVTQNQCLYLFTPDSWTLVTLLDFSTGFFLPFLIYLIRNKSPFYNHQDTASVFSVFQG